MRELQPDLFLIVPDSIPPHKALAEGSPTAQERLELCRLAFAGIPGAEISDMELQREAEKALGTNRGAVVVLDARNADVLALASAPRYDLAPFAGSAWGAATGVAEASAVFADSA